MAIIIGSPAIDRYYNSLGGYTFILLDNPSDQSGSITTIKLWVNENMDEIKVGTFERDGDDFRSRAYTTLENIVAGGTRTFNDLDIAVEIGDCIGAYWPSKRWDTDIEDYAGVYKCVGDQFGTGWQTYALSANWAISLQGIGAPPGPHPAKRSYGFVIG